MLKALKLIDFKKTITSICIFSILVGVFVYFFIVPTKEKIKKTQIDTLVLKHKIEVHNQFLPIYIEIKKKIEELNIKPIKVKKVSLAEFKNYVLASAQRYDLGVLTITPRLKENFLNKNIIDVDLVLKGEFPGYIKWIEHLLMNGYIYQISNFRVSSGIGKLDIELAVSVKI